MIDLIREYEYQTTREIKRSDLWYQAYAKVRQYALSVKWDLFAEIRERYDIDQLASGLIPTTEDAAGQEWRDHGAISPIQRTPQLFDLLRQLLARNPQPNPARAAGLADTPHEDLVPRDHELDERLIRPQ